MVMSRSDPHAEPQQLVARRTVPFAKTDSAL